MRGNKLVPPRIQYKVGVVGKLGVADLNGTILNESFVTGLGVPIGLDIDTFTGDIFIAVAGGTGGISRVASDGSGLTNLVSAADAYDVDADVANNKLYYSKFNSGVIGRADLDGTNTTRRT